MNIARGFKQLSWIGDDPVGVMISYTTLCGNKQIGFRITKCADGKLRLLDFVDDESKKYVINSVEEGKEKAQSLFDSYCREILKNIYAK